MTTKQPPAQKHLELAVKICREWKTFWMNQKQHSEADYKNYLSRAMGVDANMRCHLEDIIAKALTEAYEQGKASQVALRIEGPSDDEHIKLAAKKDIGLHRQDNRPKTCTNNDFYIAVTSAFIRGAEWYRSQLKLTHESAPTSEGLNEAIDQAWKALNAPQNETVTSRWYFKQGYLAGQGKSEPEHVWHGYALCESANGYNISAPSLKVFIRDNLEKYALYNVEFYKVPLELTTSEIKLGNDEEKQG